MLRRFAQALGAFILCGLCSLAVAQPAIELAHFDFEGPGGADPQGWLPFHRGQKDEIYFHVEDFSGAGQTATALAGTQSLWCGLSAEDPRACSVHAPGYGNDWSQVFSSREFAVTGDVTFEFLMLLANEAGYDYVFVQYEDNAGDWITLQSFDCGFAGCAAQPYSYLIPAAAHDGTIRLRFWFTSDGAFSVLDGFFPNHDALVLDDISVSDDGGQISFEDFESEAVNATSTLSGDWIADWNQDVPPDGQLVDGSTTLQETGIVNTTHMWAFTANSTEDMACVAHPEQAATPDVYNATVRSPLLDLAMDSEGHPIEGSPDSLVLEFDVYRDLGSSKRFNFSVYFYDASDCLLGNGYLSRFFSAKTWHRRSLRAVPPVDAAYAVIELGSNSFDYGATYCTTHAPLFDNVTLTRYGGIATGTPPAAGSSIVSLRQNRPNPFNPRTEIEFTLAEPRYVALRVHDVAGRLVRTLWDGLTPTGSHSTVWTGDDTAGRQVASGVYFYELQAAEERVRKRMVLLR